MMADITIDGNAVDIAAGTWKRRRIELFAMEELASGKLCVATRGSRRFAWEWTGDALLQTAADAETLRDLCHAPGYRSVDNDTGGDLLPSGGPFECLCVAQRDEGAQEDQVTVHLTLTEKDGASP